MTRKWSSELCKQIDHRAPWPPRNIRDNCLGVIFYIAEKKSFCPGRGIPYNLCNKLHAHSSVLIAYYCNIQRFTIYSDLTVFLVMWVNLANKYIVSYILWMKMKKKFKNTSDVIFFFYHT